MTPHASNKRNPEYYDDDEHCKDELIRCAEVPQLNECYTHGSVCQKVHVLVHVGTDLINSINTKGVV